MKPAFARGVILLALWFSGVGWCQIAFAESGQIILQSTTSTQNSGLFDYILPLFKAQTGIDVNVVAVGTGQALKNGRNGDGDVLLVHAKQDEQRFVDEGYGVQRLDVMYNDFILVGPVGDPAKIGQAKNILAALKKISSKQSTFISRADLSGTHKKELQLWSLAGIKTGKASDDWYIESGSGMGAVLNIAAGLGAYTISDRATWIAFSNKEDLKIISDGDPLLFNQYGVILVNPAKHPHVNDKAGKVFIKWLTGSSGQAAIGAYKLDGKQMFFPNALPKSE